MFSRVFESFCADLPFVTCDWSCVCAYELLQDLDKMRRQRADEFRDKRYEMLEQFTELLIMQVSIFVPPAFHFPSSCDVCIGIPHYTPRLVWWFDK
jgi:hypothetical protein